MNLEGNELSSFADVKMISPVSHYQANHHLACYFIFRSLSEIYLCE